MHVINAPWKAGSSGIGIGLCARVHLVTSNSVSDHCCGAMPHATAYPGPRQSTVLQQLAAIAGGHQQQLCGQQWSRRADIH